MEGEHRRGREARQDHHRLAVADREAERLSGLQGDAVGDDPGRAEAGDEPVRQIARALRGAAGEDDHVAVGEGAPDRGVERRLLVGTSAVEHRLAAVLGDRGAYDRAVAVVDRRRTERQARRDELVAGREHADAGAAMDRDRRKAAGGEHADLARADHRAAPQQRLAPGDVGAGKADELARRRGAAHLDCRPVRCRDGLGVLDHHDGVGAARDRPAGRDRRRGAAGDRKTRGDAAGDHLRVEGERRRRARASAREIGGANGEAVDARAVEGRHVERRRDVLRNDAPERVGERHGFAPERPRPQRRLEAARPLRPGAAR